MLLLFPFLQGLQDIKSRIDFLCGNSDNDIQRLLFAETEEGQTILHICGKLNNLALIEALPEKQRQANIDKSDKYNNTPLAYSAINLNFEMIKLFLDWKANTREIHASFDLLEIPMRINKIELLRWLYDYLKDHKDRKEEILKAKNLARNMEMSEFEDVFLETNSGNSEHQNDFTEKDLLVAACAKGQIHFVKHLTGKMSQDGLFNYCDVLGCTPLYAASENGKLTSIKYLVNNGADTNGRNAVCTTCPKIIPRIHPLPYMLLVKVDILLLFVI